MSSKVNTPLPVEMFPGVTKRQGQGNRWNGVLLRCPVGLLKHLDACAKANYRSRTSEILARLEASAEGESVNEHGAIVRSLPHSAK